MYSLRSLCSRSFLGLALVLIVGIMPAAASAKARDRNHDRIPDKWEQRHHLSLQVNQANRDQDRDGLDNLGEFQSRTDPRQLDTDRDGVGDADEDLDHDKVDNGNEDLEHTNPADRDSDDDGRLDGDEDEDGDGLSNLEEDRAGDNPVDADTDDDGVEDGDESSGTIVSFENGVLTIELDSGGTVSGAVNGSTEIKCKTEDEDEVEFESDDHHVKATAAHRGDDRGDEDDSRSGGSSGGSGSSGSGSSGDSGSKPEGDKSPGTGSGDKNGSGEVKGDPGKNGGPDGSKDESKAKDQPKKGDQPKNSGDKRHVEKGDEDNVCTTADLVPDAVVHEAELTQSVDSAVFEKVEIVK